ncbi:hypothetical protein FAZ98_32735 [Paraburkholderia acidisoli]|uniref:Outer membrane protein beta-barrel domain-containing protein n=2 Tax=Paraburkholderia acidisoli TaxID=2571748 RepID=A0A7Z2GSG2_9BURK|nr:hypothetical protein FAZ98_32735 [Paraburkholderia acidisoli]
MYRVARVAAGVTALVCAAGAAHGQEVYVTGGTLGAGLGGALNLGPHFGVRADAEGLGFSHDFTAGDNRYSGHLTLAQGGLYMDVFPFASSAFRFTGGAIINGDTLTAAALPNADGNYKIGNDFVPAVGGAPTAKATMPRVMPYFGVGYGHKKPVRGFGVTFDLGVAYGKPHVDYSVPGIYQLFVSQQDIADEEHDLTSKIEKYHWYPVVQVALTYRF